MSHRPSFKSGMGVVFTILIICKNVSLMHDRYGRHFTLDLNYIDHIRKNANSLV